MLIGFNTGLAGAVSTLTLVGVEGVGRIWADLSKILIRSLIGVRPELESLDMLDIAL